MQKHPTGFWFIFWGELAERASYYGMRTLLALYLVDVLGFGTSAGAGVMQVYIAACYLTPLLGGWIADRKLGRYWTIVLFSAPYIAGHLVLGGVQTRTGLLIALPLLALGAGAIKPNTSTLMGLMYEEEKKEALLGRAFSYFYAAINIGSAVASLGLPLVRNRYGYGVALAIPAVLMGLALLAFASGKRFYPREQLARPAGAGAGPKAPSIWSREQRPVLSVFLLIAVFWFVYDQTASTWVFFARDHMDLELWRGVSITPDQIQGLNAVMILALTPAFNFLWRFLRDRRGAEVADTDKMTLGFGIVFACMATMAVAGALAGQGKVSAWWAIAATFVITMAELCISVVGLEFAFRRAAAGTKSAITAAFHCMVFVGDSFGAFYDQLYQRVSPAAYFALQAVIIAAAAVVFRVVVARMFPAAPARERPPSGARGAPAAVTS